MSCSRQRAEVFRSIRQVVRSQTHPVAPDYVSQALPELSKWVVLRGLRALASNPASDLYHNGERGRNSRYGVGLKLIGVGHD